MDNNSQPVTAEQVAAYLKANPKFFIKYPAVLDLLEIATSPEGTISLVQRQINRLQDKTAQLQQRLTSLLDSARQNSALQTRMHRLCLQLIETQSLDDLLSRVVSELKQQFSADEVALRLFYLEEAPPPLPTIKENIVLLHASSDSMSMFSSLLTGNQPVCGRPDKAQSKALFNERADNIKSFVCLPIGHDPCVGIMAIASSDINRFHANIATDYLQFLVEVFGRLLKSFYEYGTPATTN